MFTDSHCHLNFPELVSQLPAIRQAMAEAQVTRALCICTTMEEFEGVHALALAHDPERLAGIKRKLADLRPNSPLFDTPRFCRHLEDLYVSMHRKAQLGQPTDQL